MSTAYRIAALLTVLSLMPLSLAAQNSNPFTSTGDTKSPQSQKTEQAETPTSSSPLLSRLITLQKRFHSRLSDAMGELQNDASTKRLLITVAAAFIYGFLHALGPGHRKTVLAGLFASRKLRKRDALYSGMGFALLHGGSAVVLVYLIFSISRGPLSVGMEKSTRVLEKGSFIALAIIGAWMMVSAIIDLIRHTEEEKKEGKMALAAIIGAGLIPCPGAALVLSFALAYQIHLYGILAVAAMSLGMGTALSIIALGAESAGKLLRSLGKGAKHRVDYGHILEAAGGAVIVLFSLLMLL